MEIRKLFVANRGEIAARVFAHVPAARHRHGGRLRPGRCRRVPHAGGRRGRPGAGATSTPRASCRLRATPAPTPSIRATGSWPRTATSPRRPRRPALSSSALPGGDPAGRRQARGEAARARGGRAGGRVGRARGDRLPADRQGGGGRRRARNARRPLARRAGGGSRSGRARGRGGLQRRPRLLRALRRAAAPRRDPAARRPARDGDPSRRARVLDPAAPPEGARGKPLPCARPRPARGHGRGRLAFARAVGYENAGTAEFMLDGDASTSSS